MRASWTILVVEEHAPDRETMLLALERAGYRALASPTGEAAVRTIASDPNAVDLVVLDTMLPGIDGWDTFRSIRDYTSAPVVFVSAVADERTAVRALGIGAHDYIAKPFNPSVFVARIEAVVRRMELASDRRVIRLGNAEVDLAAAEVRRGDERLPLTAGECRILAALAREAGRILSADDLARAARADDGESDNPAKQVKIRISRLRRKIEPRPKRPRHLLSARGRGYRLEISPRD